MVPVHYTPVLDHHGRPPYNHGRRVDDHGRRALDHHKLLLHHHRRWRHNDGDRCRNDRYGYRQLKPNRDVDTPCVR